MLIVLNNTTFGKNLLFLRTRFSVSRKGLSKLTGISTAVLRKWEAGELIPTVEQSALRRICEIFQVDSKAIIHTDLESPNPDPAKKCFAAPPVEC